MTETALIFAQSELPTDSDWLGLQPAPVIVHSTRQACDNADVIVADRNAALALKKRIDAFPLSAMILVQLLRSSERLSVSQALDMESLAYSTLQSGPEFAAWKAAYQPPPEPQPDPGEAILLSRTENRLNAVLNRPGTRNSISVEMRDALVDMLELLRLDTSLQLLQVTAAGACFSVGGELREFGKAPDPATAHWVRSVQSPARLLAQHSSRIACYVHGACIGSGIELPAFAHHLVAHPKTFFQLPELQLGLIPGAGGTVSITRRIGRQRLAWLVLSGRRINVDTALEWGLIDAIDDTPPKRS